MIPKFPEFKILELSDKEEVEKFTLKYPPYSDYNFLGTWSWDIRGEMKISQLNENYVIRFINYLTGVPFYTFLGGNKINETIKELLDLSIKENLRPELKLIPEQFTKDINTTIYNIVEDRDNFDYIFNISELKDYAGQKFSKKRNRFSAFVKNYPNAEARVISLQDTAIQSAIINLYDKWFQAKMKVDISYETHKEIIVIKKLMSAKDVGNLFAMGVFLDEKMLAFSIDEIMPSEYVVSHVVKCDHDFAGAHEFLIKKISELLFSKNKNLLNQEQDLGIDSMREAKMRFRPCFFLKKYTISSV